jgi:hypothetical protein
MPMHEQRFREFLRTLMPDQFCEFCQAFMDDLDCQTEKNRREKRKKMH